jgi:hypothetical protein
MDLILHLETISRLPKHKPTPLLSYSSTAYGVTAEILATIGCSKQAGNPSPNGF